jgi:multidrug efflux pump
MFITLKPRRERNVTATEVVARIRGKTARIPGIGVFLQAAQDIRIGGRATKGQYIYSLVSPSQEDLNTYVPKLLAELQKNPKLKDLTTDQQQLGLQSNVIVDRVKASQLGIQPQQVDSALDSAFGQRQVSVVYNDRDQFHVVLEASPHGPQLVVQKFLPAVFDVFREPDPVDVQLRGEGQE